MDKGKTSTFTIHHDTCCPADWKPADILVFNSFVATGNLQYAAQLARLGVQLVLSDHHVPTGGTLEEIGWAEPGEIYDGLIHDNLQDAVENGGDLDVTALCRVYRGPTEYVAKFGVGDADGEFDGNEFEIKPTQADAEAFIASLSE